LARNEFVLHYQPQLRLSDNSLTGFEALIRWRHPELGMVSPARFIPLAERRGLITEIGLWVMREACRQNEEWRRERVADAPMAVNLSSTQLASASFADDVQGILSETGMPANRLEIELTESLLLDDAELKLERVQTLKRLGVSLAIDDFGTGYSSLSYLKRLPVAKLKIDQSFVRDICSDASDQAIAEAIISMGQSLRLIVIAEGVETNDQRSLLKQIGCNEAQGYLFARPMPAEDIGPWLANQGAHVARDTGNWSG
jgi:EAL domain-containing protein (putative c-di-GMP-specific phosphodiesterase class I)